MAQNFLFLKPSENEPIDRIINLDLMSSAFKNPDPNAKEKTIVWVGTGEIKMGMPFDEFLIHVQRLIAENYKLGHDYSLARENERMVALGKVMSDVMKCDH